MPVIYPLLDYWKGALAKGLVKPMSRLDFRPLIENKKTAFVLGTGHSVLDLSPDDEEAVKRGFSIGINNWPVHPRIVPSVLLHESASAETISDWGRILSRRYAQDRVYGPVDNVPWLIKDCWSSEFDLNLVPGWLSSAAYISTEQFVNGGVPAIEANLAKMMEQSSFGIYDKANGAVLAVPSRKASFVYATSLCAMLGFKKIVLVGIDLRGSGHFYTCNKTPDAKHGTDDPAVVGYPTSSQVFMAFYRMVFKPLGITIQVSEKSALYKLINGE